jgi:type IV pilus assembly protein PilM
MPHLTDGKRKREIAAANRLLEVIRGERATLEAKTPAEGEQASATPEIVLPSEKKSKRRHPLSLFSRRTIGLDVGSHTIKCVQLEKRGFNRFELLQADAFSVFREEKNPEDDNGTHGRVNAIRRVLGGIPLHRARIVTAVGGVSTAIRQVELPKMSARELSSSINLWARNYIPFDVKEVQLDYQVFGFDRASRKIRLLLVAVMKDHIQQHIKLLHEAGIDPVLVDLNPLAVMNALLFSEQIRDDQCIIVLDIGDRNTTLCIYSETGQYFVRNLMISGNDFTRDIQRRLALSYGDAERYKRGEMASSERSEGSTNLVETIKPSLDALIQEVRRSLTYYENQTKTRGFSQIILTGGSAQMEGLGQYLGGELGLPVRIFDPFREIESRDVSLPASPNQFALAVGLALREPK